MNIGTSGNITIISGQHKIPDKYAGNGSGYVNTLTLKSTLKFTVEDTTEISPEGKAAYDSTLDVAHEEKNYESMIGDMSKRLKDIFTSLLAWSKEIMQNAAVENNNAFGAKDIIENIKNSFVNPSDDEESEIDYRKEFSNAVSQYFKAFREAVETIAEEMEEEFDKLVEESGMSEASVRMFTELGDLVDLLNEIADNLVRFTDVEFFPIWDRDGDSGLLYVTKDVFLKRLEEDHAEKERVTAERQAARDADIETIEAAGMNSVARGIDRDGNMTEHDLSKIAPVIINPFTGKAMSDPYEAHVKFLVAGTQKTLAGMQKWDGVSLADISESKIIFVNRDVSEKFNYLYA